MDGDDINEYLPSLLNPRKIKKNDFNLSLSKNRLSPLSLKRKSAISNFKNGTSEINNKENSTNELFIGPPASNVVTKRKIINEIDSIGLSDIEDINSLKTHSISVKPHSCDMIEGLEIFEKLTHNNNNSPSETVLTPTPSADSEGTVIYDTYERVAIPLSFSISNCNKIDLSSNKNNMNKVLVSHGKTITNINCELIEGSQISESTGCEKNLDDLDEQNSQSATKRKAVTVNIEIKKHKLSTTEDSTEKAKVLILKTNAFEKFTHVIVQPPNYKLFAKRRKINNNSKVENIQLKSGLGCGTGKEKCVTSVNKKQKRIDAYFRCKHVLKTKVDERILDSLSEKLRTNVCEVEELVRDDAQDMSKNSPVADVKCDGPTILKSNRNELSKTPRLLRSPSPKRNIKASNSDAPRTLSPKSKKDSVGSFSPRKNIETIQFSLPLKSKSNKTSTVARNIPHYKIVAGTHFAVDAFSYGEIPNVKHYFLTHFHSDHYSGLRKSFNKLLFCSKITADLCVSRLGVNSKCIHVINVDQTIRLDGVEVNAIDANHCPGALMLVFTLPNGKTMLHTGDFRASPEMESSPIFWNKDVHTIYLDTTYCNPRYDFPTQDQSLDMAVHFLRQKKLALEKAGKKFSSVLIVCGTYTIGKEKFFLGMSRRVGCSVWACPEKDRVLQAVERRSFSHASPRSCQLHVVPMRDLTHEKLRSYLDSLQGAFTEVVAFKPSGWENGKDSSVEKDSVTIHGIPYSEHSSFSELIRFVKFIRPKQVVPTVDIAGGIKSVQKYFPCPLVNKDDVLCQSRVTDFFSIQSRQPVSAVT